MVCYAWLQEEEVFCLSLSSAKEKRGPSSGRDETLYLCTSGETQNRLRFSSINMSYYVIKEKMEGKQYEAVGVL